MNTPSALLRRRCIFLCFAFSLLFASCNTDGPAPATAIPDRPQPIVVSGGGDGSSDADTTVSVPSDPRSSEMPAGYEAWFSSSLLDMKSGGSGDFVRPNVISRTTPEYPIKLGRARMPGLVRVLFILGKDGRVHAPIVYMSTDDAFIVPVLKALSEWRIKPATLNGEPIDVCIHQDIPFQVAPKGSGSPFDANASGNIVERRREYVLPILKNDPQGNVRVKGLAAPVFVRMRYVVDEKGRVMALDYINSDDPVVVAYVKGFLRRLIFSPAKLNGSPVKWMVSGELLLYPAE